MTDLNELDGTAAYSLSSFKLTVGNEGDTLLAKHFPRLSSMQSFKRAVSGEGYSRVLERSEVKGEEVVSYLFLRDSDTAEPKRSSAAELIAQPRSSRGQARDEPAPAEAPSPKRLLRELKLLAEDLAPAVPAKKPSRELMRLAEDLLPVAVPEKRRSVAPSDPILSSCDSIGDSGRKGSSKRSASNGSGQATRRRSGSNIPRGTSSNEGSTSSIKKRRASDGGALLDLSPARPTPSTKNRMSKLPDVPLADEVEVLCELPQGAWYGVALEHF